LFAPGSTFWYYNHDVVWPQGNGPKEVASLDLRAELAAHDVVLLLFNTANMGGLDFGFGAQAARVLAETP
jgi:hypothetical protein